MGETDKYYIEKGIIHREGYVDGFLAGRELLREYLKITPTT